MAASSPSRFRPLWLRLLLVFVLLFTAWLVWLDATVTARFEGRRWEIPSRVYARPLELYEGASVEPELLAWELRQLGYQPVVRPASPGTFARDGDRFRIHRRSFLFPDGRKPGGLVELAIEDDRVTQLTVPEGASALARLEPLQIGGIYPDHNEDRLLVRLQDVPETLVQGLIQIEDQDFYQHWGLSPLSIARAAWVNLRAGAVVQGGSTLTQQLVKNLFLTREQTLWRKVQEAFMALLLEWHYEKTLILETYLNEVYLGQAGRRAIHGVGLASTFYFGRPLSELDVHQQALLVALVKGPSYYDPRRHPERALERRNLVLREMAKAGILTAEKAHQARERPLDLSPRPVYQDQRYPAYLDLVRRHLARDYREEDLQAEGLRIFTALDPMVQRAARQGMEHTLNRLDRQGTAAQLEGAMTVTARERSEVVALVGGRDAGFSGFNRALDARRSIGSLIKPVIYLAALSQPDRYTLITPVRDEPFTLVADDGREWSPDNFSGRAHGEVPLLEAFSHSYNLATVRVGMDLGLDRVRETLASLGAGQGLSRYPSLLLGAQSLSPLEVTRVYQALAAGGFVGPLRSIRAVTTAEGETLSRYALEVNQVAPPGPVHLVQYAMQTVMQEGTGRSAYRQLPRELTAAGKTGTTNENRDSWFAGFTGDYLGVVWLGHDDNAPTALTGATGALQVWANVMARLPQRPLSPVVPDGVNYLWVDPERRVITDAGCKGARPVPFIAGSEPTRRVDCQGRILDSLKGWLEGWFGQ